MEKVALSKYSTVFMQVHRMVDPKPPDAIKDPNTPKQTAAITHTATT